MSFSANSTLRDIARESGIAIPDAAGAGARSEYQTIGERADTSAHYVHHCYCYNLLTLILSPLCVSQHAAVRGVGPGGRRQEDGG